MRNIRRKNEQVYWAPIPKPYGLTQVSLAGTMGGMTSLTRGLDLRIKPFVVGGGRRDRSGDTVVQRPAPRRGPRREVRAWSPGWRST